MRKIIIGLAVVSAFALVRPAPSSAQEGLKAVAATLWNVVRAPFQREGVTVKSASVPKSPVNLARPQEEVEEFWEALRDAGYELREFTTVIGIIPEAKMQYQMVRELSDADRDAIERRIEIDEMRRRGMKAAIQRQILRTVLAASNLREMRLVKLDITLLPLPAAEFVLEPVEAPLGEEHDAILRAVQGNSSELRKFTRSMNMVSKPFAKPEAPAVD